MLLDISNLYNIHICYEEAIKDEKVLIISVDEGDVVHEYEKSFELIFFKVRDGTVLFGTI